jgi:hypothetical protein
MPTLQKETQKHSVIFTRKNTDRVYFVELHPICLLAVWPVLVSYQHLPVGILGLVFLYCKIWRELHFVKFCGNSFL